MQPSRGWDGQKGRGVEGRSRNAWDYDQHGQITQHSQAKKEMRGFASSTGIASPSTITLGILTDTSGSFAALPITTSTESPNSYVRESRNLGLHPVHHQVPSICKDAIYNS